MSKYIARSSTKLIDPASLVTRMVAVWTDDRTADSNVYVQAIDANGAAIGTANGNKVSASTGSHFLEFGTCKDGSTGSFVAFNDYRSGVRLDVYCQRLSTALAEQWAAGGVAICTAAAGDKTNVVVVPDGLGGAIIAWKDARGGASKNSIYVQRINSAGAVQWTANGVKADSDATRDCYDQLLVSDGAGGCIVAWAAATLSNVKVMAQRFNSSGSAQWTAGGVTVLSTTAGGTTADPLGGLLYDSGGCYVAMRNTSSQAVIQRLASDGSVHSGSWTTDGIAIGSSVYGSTARPSLVTDGSGGVIVTWPSSASGTAKIYAQRVDSTGAIQWTSGGLVAATLPGTVAAGYSLGEWKTVMADGSGGAFVVVSYNAPASSSEAMCARINSSGTVLWTTTVAALSALYTQVVRDIASDGVSGAWLPIERYIISSNEYDVLCQRVDADGNTRLSSLVTVSGASGNQSRPLAHGA